MPLPTAVSPHPPGAGGAAAAAIRKSRPDMIIHLGDYARDAASLKEEFPGIELRSVRGNCDFASRALLSDCFYAGKMRLFISHGHEYGVKSGLAALRGAAHAAGADMVLFGHTHRPLFQREDGLLLLNPGSAGCPPRTTWARLEIGEDGGVSCRILDL